MIPKLDRRLSFMGVLIIGLFAALFTRLWYLQVLNTEDLEKKAESNQIEMVVTAPNRGRIFDRHGVVLADNLRTGIVTVNKSRYSPGQLEFIISELSSILGIAEDVLKSRLNDLQTHRLAAKVVATGLNEEGLLRISERSLPGVEAKWEMTRTYPREEVAAHILGYVGAMSEQQAPGLLDDGYLLSERVGRAGIEALFESQLHGSPGITKLEVDNAGRVHRIIGDQQAKPGNDIILSIDADLQAATESFLAQGLLAARETVSDDSGFFYPAVGGAAVVLDLRNGDVLAMASYPTYNPNWLVGGLTFDEYKSVFENPYAPGALNNRAIQGLYAPGSTFKLVTALAGLEARLISPRNTYYDVGYFKIPDEYGCTGRCTFFNADKAALGTLDLSTALTRSSDAYFYQVAHDLYWIKGEEEWAIQDMASQLGFGGQTGVQLPYEKAGRIPDGDTKKTLFELNPEAYNPYKATSDWLPGDNINTGIGQGFVSATPIQLVNAYAAFANGGTLFSPNIVERIISRSSENFGESVIEFEPKIQRIIDFPEGSPVVSEGLGGVTSQQRRGTAWKAFEGYDAVSYSVAGKTGTAQADGKNAVLQRKKEDSAIFVAWAPQHDPRYAVAVVMEEAGYGGEAAAPVARQIFEALRAYEQRWSEPQIAFIPPSPACPEIPEALRGNPAFTSFVPEGCPWGIQIPRANNAQDVNGDGVDDQKVRD